jgi:hypothetical protein
MMTRFAIILLFTIFFGCREINYPFENNSKDNLLTAREEFQIILPKSGDLWLINGTYEIKWLSLLKANFVVIELYRKNTLKEIISPRTENDGSLFYTVSPELAPSNLYKIKIYNFDNPNETALSNYFSIR